MSKQEKVNASINITVIASLFLASCYPESQNPTVNVDPTQIKPGETLVVPELTATVEPTKVIEPIMRFSEAELPAEFVLGLEKLVHAVPAWESKTSDELEFDHFVFTKADDSYQETSILVTVDGLTYVLIRSAKEINSPDEVLADTALKPLLVATKDDGQLMYFTQRVNDSGEIENQKLMEGMVKDGESVTVVYLLDGNTIESEVDLININQDTKYKIAAIDAPSDYLTGEISFNSQTGELTATNITGDEVVWDGEARQWVSKAEKNQSILAELKNGWEAKSGPSLENASSPLQWITLEGPNGESREVIGQSNGPLFWGVTPELRDKDYFSEYGYFESDLRNPFKKAGEVLRFTGTEDQARVGSMYGEVLHMILANHMADTVLPDYMQSKQYSLEEAEGILTVEQNRYLDWIRSNPDNYQYKVMRHEYPADSNIYVEKEEILEVDPRTKIYIALGEAWEDIPGNDIASKEKNSGAVIMDDYNIAIETWTTSDNELVFVVHQIRFSIYPLLIPNAPSNVCVGLSGEAKGAGYFDTFCGKLNKVSVFAMITSDLAGIYQFKPVN